MADSLIRTAKKFQFKRPSTSTKFSGVTLQLMKKRRELKTPSTTKEKIEYAELSKTIRKKQKLDINISMCITNPNNVKKKFLCHLFLFFLAFCIFVNT